MYKNGVISLPVCFTITETSKIKTPKGQYQVQFGVYAVFELLCIYWQKRVTMSVIEFRKLGNSNLLNTKEHKGGWYTTWATYISSMYSCKY